MRGALGPFRWRDLSDCPRVTMPRQTLPVYASARRDPRPSRAEARGRRLMRHRAGRGPPENAGAIEAESNTQGVLPARARSSRAVLKSSRGTRPQRISEGELPIFLRRPIGDRPLRLGRGFDRGLNSSGPQEIQRPRSWVIFNGSGEEKRQLGVVVGTM